MRPRRSRPSAAGPAAGATALALALLAPVPGAAGQDEFREVDSGLRMLVDQLDDPAFALREQAARQLVELPCDQAEIYLLLADDVLSLEQRHRLVSIAQQRLVSIPRGALGISMRPARLEQGVGEEARAIEVFALIDGLPAERVLEVGDIITHIDDQRAIDQEELRNYVQLRRPGDHVKLLVQRVRRGDDGNDVLDAQRRPVRDTIEIEMALGSVERLERNEAPRTRGSSASQVYHRRVAEARAIAGQYRPTPRRVVLPD